MTRTIGIQRVVVPLVCLRHGEIFRLGQAKRIVKPDISMRIPQRYTQDI